MSIVRKYRARVVDVQQRLPDVYTVQLESESGRFKYHPGQFLHLALDEYDPRQGMAGVALFFDADKPGSGSGRYYIYNEG